MLTLPRTDQIAVLPITRTRALVVLWNPDVTLAEITAVVELDPGLTAAVLRAANSVASAPMCPIERAHDAVVRLGLVTVKEIATAAVVWGEFNTLDGSLLRMNELWRHLLATALLAETAAEAGMRGGVAFT